MGIRLTKHRTRFFTIMLAVSIGMCVGLRAERNDWAEGTEGFNDGATRDFYNRGGYLPWVNFLGDWIDVDGVAQGDTAYATTAITDNDTSQYVEWDATALVGDSIAVRVLEIPDVGRCPNEDTTVEATESRRPGQVIGVDG